MRKLRHGRMVCPGGRSLELVADHPEWLDWAQAVLDAAARAERRITSGGSVECPHCHWGFAPTVIEQHIRDKH